MRTLFTTVILLAVSSLALAQGAPPPPRGGDEGGARRGRAEPPPPPRTPQQYIERPHATQLAPAHATGPVFVDPVRSSQLELLRGYLGVVDSFTRLSRDPAQAGIAAVISANEILKPRGADAAIDYFTKLLPEVKHPAVQRAIRVQLAELYKASGKHDQALEQLRELIVTTTGDEGPPSPPQPPNPEQRR